MKKEVLALILSIFLYSCSDIKTEHLVDKYYLLSSPEVPNISLDYELTSGGYIGVVGVVMSVGYNKDFIIAKQYPYDSTGVHYYIIPITSPVDDFPDDNKIGPLTKAEFEMKRKERGVPVALTFTKDILLNSTK